MASQLKASLDELRKLREREADRLLGFGNVIGIGLGQKKIQDKYSSEPAIVVYVSEKLPTQLCGKHKIPSKLRLGNVTVKTDVIELDNIHNQHGEPPYFCSDDYQQGTVTALCMKGAGQVFGATCTHCLTGEDQDPYTPDKIYLASQYDDDFAYIGISDENPLDSNGFGLPGNYGFLDASLFTIEDNALKAKTELFATPMKFWEYPRKGTKVFLELSLGRKVTGTINAVELIVDDFFVDVLIDIDYPGTFKGDSGGLWRTASGNAVAVHCKGAGAHTDGSSSYSLCMYAHRMQRELGVEFRE